MDQRHVKEDSSVSALRKRDKEGSSGTNVPGVPQRAGWERRGGNAQTSSLHLFWGLKQIIEYELHVK